MAEYLQIFRVRVPQETVATLLEIEPVAIAEAQRLCPALLRAELVRLDDDTWLHVLRWSRGDGEEQDHQRLECAMHDNNLLFLGIGGIGGTRGFRRHGRRSPMRNR